MGYLVGVTIPFLVLLLSHLSLEVFFIWKKKYTQKNQTMVVVLSLAYAIFLLPSSFPLFPVELGVQIDVFWYLVFYSWYWWMYAVNVFIYMITDHDFGTCTSYFSRMSLAVSMAKWRIIECGL